MVLHSNYGLPDDQRATDWPRKRYGWLNIVGVRNFFFFKLRPSFKTHPLSFTNFFFFFISVKFQNIPIQQQQRFSMITNTENSSLEPWAAEVDLSLGFRKYLSLSLSRSQSPSPSRSQFRSPLLPSFSLSRVRVRVGILGMGFFFFFFSNFWIFFN